MFCQTLLWFSWLGWYAYCLVFIPPKARLNADILWNLDQEWVIVLFFLNIYHVPSESGFPLLGSCRLCVGDGCCLACFNHCNSSIERLLRPKNGVTVSKNPLSYITVYERNTINLHDPPWASVYAGSKVYGYRYDYNYTARRGYQCLHI